MNLLVQGLCAVLIAGPLFAAPDDLDDAFQKLKEATESKKDADEVKKLAAQTCELARKSVNSQSADNEVTRAHEIEAYADYALYARAVEGPAATTVDLMAALEQQNPKSKYLDQGYPNYLYALSQTGASAKIPAVAEKGLANFPNNDDLLLVLADAAMSKKQSDRALSYASRLIAAVNKRAKPEGMSSADWERKRNQELGRGYWISGLVHADKSRFFDADKDLRAALPLIQGNEGLLGPALFSLGLADYNLGKSTMNKAKVLDAVKFSEQAAAIKGPFADQARHNAIVMRTEAGRMH